MVASKKKVENETVEDRIQKELKKLKLSDKENSIILKNLKDINPKKYTTKTLPITNKHVKFGYFSDAHMGHNNYRPDILSSAAKEWKKEGVEFVVNSGDTIEGMSGRDGHIYELSHIGATAQLDYAAKELEKLKDWDVYSIEADSSHGGWFRSKCNMGLDVGDELERRCPNYKFIGYDEQDLKLDNGLIIRLRHPGGGSAYALCFDDKTEIMTENGWKFFKDLNTDEKVATLNMNKNVLEWELPTEYTDEEYDGELIHFKNKNVDMMVTPNHRMLVRRYPTNILNGKKDNLEHENKSHGTIDFDWLFKEANELKTAKVQEWQMRRGGIKWKGERIDKITLPYREPKKYTTTQIKHFEELPIEDVAELIAWYVTEGNIQKSLIQITQYKKVNEENYNRILNLVERIGLKASEDKPQHHINMYSTELAEWLLKECGHLSRNKYLPKWLKNQTSDILQIVFITMIQGDGWINDKGYGYKSISKQLLEDFAEIAIKLGYAITFNKDSVSVSSIQVLPTINKSPEVIQYSGKIYCVSVPNTTIMVRRNGKTCWSGNSYKMQKYIESISGGQKPHILIQGHFHKHNTMFYRNIYGIDAGALQEQSPFLKKSGSPSHIGFGMCDVFFTKKNGIEKLIHTFVPFYE